LGFAVEEISFLASIRLIEFRGVRVQETAPELRTMIDDLTATVARQYGSAVIGEIPTVRAVRTIFHKTGVDPTRYRPSSEALLRRVVKGKGLYFINSAVDVVNYFSLKTLLPMGVFDADLVAPPVEFRAGRAGETYQGVGRDVLNLAGFPLLADAQGPFGSAVSDSVRTRVSDRTTGLLWATFVPQGQSPDFEEFAAVMIRFNGGVVDQNTVFHTA
jgi:DNA/RNA-binding domain of Phe-tRNA-synthetase-like protein